MPSLGRPPKVEKPVTIDQLDELPSPLRQHKPTMRQRLIEFAACAVMLSILMALMDVFDFRRYQPPRDLATIDQLAADPPDTLKFAVVEQGGRPFVVWIGGSGRVFASGPPVCAFNQIGNLVDRTSDAGDFGSPFVRQLYADAYESPGISAAEAVTYCRKNRGPKVHKPAKPGL